MLKHACFDLCVAISLIILATAAGCDRHSSPPAKRHLSVAAASDLKFAMDALVNEFEEQNPAIDVEANFGSSGTFFAQISQKAPFDVFFSADVSYPTQLIENGLADAQAKRIYAIGQIVIWVRKESSFDIDKSGMESLLDPSIRSIALANPKHAPYGKAAMAAMENSGLIDRVREKLVLGENVSQAAQFLQSGSADIGIIALSLANSPKMREQGRFWQIPQDMYPKMEQMSVVLTHAKDKEAAGLFQQFISSRRGREVLTSFGFKMPSE